MALSHADLDILRIFKKPTAPMPIIRSMAWLALHPYLNTANKATGRSINADMVYEMNMAPK